MLCSKNIQLHTISIFGLNHKLNILNQHKLNNLLKISNIQRDMLSKFHLLNIMHM